jgi:protein O-GlcNAc transferase
VATPSRYADWLQRGRVHQWEGRPVDAMLCFERAAAEAPNEADPRFLLGETNWQLGRIPAAVTAWRDAARVAPSHLAPHLALAEALLALGDLRGGFEAAGVALSIAPDNTDAAILHAIAGIASGADAAAWERLARVIPIDARRVAAPAPGGTLARVLEHAGEPGDRVLAALLPHLDTIAMSLLVPLGARALAATADDALRSARPAIVRAALERELPQDDLDVLRRLALLHARAGERDAATALATRYAQACMVFVQPGTPIGWPRRPAQAELRIHALIAAHSSNASVELLAQVAQGWRDAKWTLLVDDTASLPPLPSSLSSTTVRPLPAALDAVLADAMARDAPDAVLDFAGVALASGSLLAMRPAPVILGVDVGAAAHRPPLVDEVVAADVQSLRAAMSGVASLARGRPSGALGTDQLIALFDGAIEAHREGRDDEAAARYEALLTDQPEHAPSLHLLAALRRESGELEAAEALLARALAQAPAFMDARVARARLARDRGRIDEGLAIIDAGFDAPGAPATLYAVKGELELARDDGAAAEAAFAEALARRPTDAQSHYNLGVALHKQGRRADAARAYSRALAFDAGFADAHFNLAVLFQESGAVDAAVTAYRAVLDRDPLRVAAYRNLGEVLLGAGRIDEWLANFRRFEARCPDALPLAVQALEACQYAADTAGLERYLEGLRNERYKTRDATELVDSLEQLLYLLLFFDVEPEMVFRFAQTYSATAAKVYGAPLTIAAERRPGKLRIGYLSADLRNHVMGKMMWQALQHHDLDRFALHFYSLSPVRDEWTARFESIAEQFEILAGRSEREAAQRIAQDDVDLLVDLSGHTKGGKPGILARKPARVQLTHVASAGSVGLETVEFKLTDRYAEVEANQETMLERLLPMDGCVYPFRHIAPAEPNPFTRAALGIAAETIVIGAFVTPMKLSRRCLTLWRDVLQRVPRAKLAFSPNHPALRPVLERITLAAGIGRDRLLFLPQGRDDAQNQARYAIVDFVLDPMPFGGVNGVIEPLDAGVPVVTLVGKRHGERSAYSILANLGVTTTVAHGGREYVDIAVRLADDAAFMKATRAAIVAGLAGSPLTDMVAHTRHLEAAYLRAIEAGRRDA